MDNPFETLSSYEIYRNYDFENRNHTYSSLCNCHTCRRTSLMNLYSQTFEKCREGALTSTSSKVEIESTIKKIIEAIPGVIEATVIFNQTDMFNLFGNNLLLIVKGGSFTRISKEVKTYCPDGFKLIFARHI